MSSIGMPMSGIDEAMLLRLERALRSVEPDPLFRRRLRGRLLNSYVATREGLIAEPRPQRQMGRLGRSVLYASLAVALSVSTAGAAAHDSLPGDALYGVKLQLEGVRMRIAPPSVRSDLAAIALAERIEELERLTASGAWTMVPPAAARMIEARDTLIALDPDTKAHAASGGLGAIDAIESAMAEASPTARRGLERALRAVEPSASHTGEAARPGRARGESNVPRDPGRPSTVPKAPDATREPNPRAEESGRRSRAPAASPEQSSNAPEARDNKGTRTAGSRT